MSTKRKSIIVIILLISTLFFIKFAIDRREVYNFDLRIEKAFPNIEFDKPVDFQSTPDDSDLIFVVEQAGIIKVFQNNPKVSSTSIFLDISNRVESGGEKGMLGLAFHPNYTRNGLFFVYYMVDNPLRSRVSSFVVYADRSEANQNSEKIILEISQPYSNHNGGQIIFGDDGYLYIGLGDGGSGGDPENNGQDLTTLLGTILRIDVDNVSDSRNYSIPNDNPYYSNTNGYKEEIYAYGLRNPWRMSFDIETGNLWVGDVGQNKIEEVDIIESGKNYGWNTMEGSSCYNANTCETTGLELPVAEYDHSLGISITGGYVYRGSIHESLVGNYIFGDYGTGRIWKLDINNLTGGIIQLMKVNLNIVSFGTDNMNELYILAFDGFIYKFV
ncbi:MAG: PQQ-dependent sugar dehydrogenase [Candidatus Heimdallarchaeota archaeon]|nr:PQQ-dependent sugar dehydrogenase [Candidatus Heimdallarchaeota archaeon]